MNYVIHPLKKSARKKIITFFENKDHGMHSSYFVILTLLKKIKIKISILSRSDHSFVILIC
jgi:hypothetical protein